MHTQTHACTQNLSHEGSKEKGFVSRSAARHVALTFLYFGYFRQILTDLYYDCKLGFEYTRITLAHW